MTATKERVAQLRVLIQENKRELQEIQNSCAHEFERHGSDAGECVNCGIQGGWYCEVADDHTCHYYCDQTHLKDDIFLVQGKETKAPITRGEVFDDGCAFCDGPEERK